MFRTDADTFIDFNVEQLVAVRACKEALEHFGVALDHGN